jgi:hypothetical protein
MLGPDYAALIGPYLEGIGKKGKES